ncbi:hypothetical protein [Prosthecobacter sp.]|uniref:hypothetical protein n=1 Tax=Prosthecobacter sp. TaxID=1965333 RepID=UPI002ABC7700|nr:hypothetical protein [Prosthecobacter sp.]MDZ4401914.1 hypothetical protein [Prosthecobacter sp.]
MKTSFPFPLMIAACAALVGLASVAGFFMFKEPKPPLAQPLQPQMRTSRTSPPSAAAPLSEQVQPSASSVKTADVTALGIRLAKATPEETIQISGELAAQGKAAEPGLIAALKEPLPAGVRGSIANILGRIGSDGGIQAAMDAVIAETDPATRNALISGLTAGVESPEAAGLLASAALITDDPALLAPVVETVGRLGDEPVLRDLVGMFQEPETSAGQRVIIAQMIAALRNPELGTLLAGMAASDATGQPLREAAETAIKQQSSTSAPNANP